MNPILQLSEKNLNPISRNLVNCVGRLVMNSKSVLVYLKKLARYELIYLNIFFEIIITILIVVLSEVAF